MPQCLVIQESRVQLSFYIEIPLDVFSSPLYINTLISKVFGDARCSQVNQTRIFLRCVFALCVIVVHFSLAGALQRCISTTKCRSVAILCVPRQREDHIHTYTLSNTIAKLKLFVEYNRNRCFYFFQLANKATALRARNLSQVRMCFARFFKLALSRLSYIHHFPIVIRLGIVASVSQRASTTTSSARHRRDAGCRRNHRAIDIVVVIVIDDNDSDVCCSFIADVASRTRSRLSISRACRRRLVCQRQQSCRR